VGKGYKQRCGRDLNGKVIHTAAPKGIGLNYEGGLLTNFERFKDLEGNYKEAEGKAWYSCRVRGEKNSARSEGRRETDLVSGRGQEKGVTIFASCVSVYPL